MPPYFLVDIREIKDAAKVEDYKARVTPVVKFGGRYLVIGGPFAVLEGSSSPVFPVMIQFPDMDQARRWYDSEEYSELKSLRLAATASHATLMAGSWPDETRALPVRGRARSEPEDGDRGSCCAPVWVRRRAKPELRSRKPFDEMHGSAANRAVPE